MIKCTFKKLLGHTYWAICQSFTYDSVDGWTLNGVLRTSESDKPCTGAGLPNYVEFVKAEEVDEDGK